MAPQKSNYLNPEKAKTFVSLKLIMSSAIQRPEVSDIETSYSTRQVGVSITRDKAKNLILTEG